MIRLGRLQTGDLCLQRLLYDIRTVQARRGALRVLLDQVPEVGAITFLLPRHLQYRLRLSVLNIPNRLILLFLLSRHLPLLLFRCPRTQLQGVYTTSLLHLFLQQRVDHAMPCGLHLGSEGVGCYHNPMRTLD